MATLKDIQAEIDRQLTRDYANKPKDVVKPMCFLGLAEEAGEVAGLLKRVLRNFPRDKERITREKFVEELGDVFWYLTACCSCCSISLDEIWEYNIQKLEERYEK